MEKTELIALVARAQSGDQAAMEEVLRAAHTSVSYQCRKLLRDPRDAEDMTQEVLLAVYTKLDTLKTPEAFWSWLNQTTANRCVNAIKRSRVEFQFAEDEEGHSVLDNLEEVDEQQVPDRALDNAETTRMIEEIVDSLPDAQRVCTLMYYYDEMSVREIASALGVSENTVKSRLNYARKAVKERVLDYEKKGVKLYGLSPLPFMLFFLLRAAGESADSAKAAAAAKRIMEVGAAAAAAGGSAAAAGGSAAASGGSAAAAGGSAAASGGSAAASGGSAAAGGTAAAGGLSAKVIAGVLAGLLLVGGATAAVVNSTRSADEREPAFSWALPGWNEGNETGPVETRSPATIPDGYPPDPRWADLKPGETAVQYQDIFVKSGMTLGEAMDSINQSRHYFSTSLDPAALDEVRTCSGDSDAKPKYVDTPYFYIGYLENLPGEPGTTYRLRDCPVYTVFSFSSISDMRPDSLVTRIGTFGELRAMDLETIQGVVETALAGMGAELDVGPLTYNGVKVTEYHYTYRRHFSWNGYTLRTPGSEDGFVSDAHFQIAVDTGKVHEKGTMYIDRPGFEVNLIWVPEG